MPCSYAYAAIRLARYARQVLLRHIDVDSRRAAGARDMRRVGRAYVSLLRRCYKIHNIRKRSAAERYSVVLLSRDRCRAALRLRAMSVHCCAKIEAALSVADRQHINKRRMPMITRSR